MRFLIAIKDTSKESKNILHIGMTIASAFNADISVIYVGWKVRGLNEKDISLTRDSLAEWDIFHPGVEVLEWAFNTLKELGFLGDDELKFYPKNLIEEKDRFRMVLPQMSGNKIRLILREGVLLQELKKETEFRNYELAVIGYTDKKRITRKIIQFLDTSILIVNNLQPSKNYKLLLCVDDSAATKRAVIFGGIISSQFGSHIKAITVSKTGKFNKGYKNASRWTEKYLSMKKITFESKMLTGNPVDVIIREAGTNHLVIMGKSEKNELLKFLFSSKPIQTVLKADCPVLVVKNNP